MVLALHTVTIKVEKDLKRRMKRVKMNWSAYIRDAIEERIRVEDRRVAASLLREDIGGGDGRVPEGFIGATIREGREGR